MSTAISWEDGMTGQSSDIESYALLTHPMARATSLAPGEVVHTTIDLKGSRPHSAISASIAV